MESSEPPRKRRRPALSCIQCRRRKVKCDRNEPCNQCKSSRKAHNCSYRADPLETDPNEDAVNAHSAHPLENSSTPSIQFAIKDGIGLSDALPTPDSTPKTVNAYDTNSYESGKPAVASPNVSPASETLATLERELSVLKRAMCTTVIAADGETQSPRSNGLKIHGALDKTRLLGPSHWMTSIVLADQVRSSLLHRMLPLGHFYHQPASAVLQTDARVN